jgi:hypothetical protein
VLKVRLTGQIVTYLKAKPHFIICEICG